MAIVTALRWVFERQQHDRQSTPIILWCKQAEEVWLWFCFVGKTDIVQNLNLRCDTGTTRQKGKLRLTAAAHISGFSPPNLRYSDK